SAGGVARLDHQAIKRAAGAALFSYRDSCQRTRRRRMANAISRAAKPSSASEPGSGISLGMGTPGTVEPTAPSSGPNENMTLAIVVLAVTPCRARLNVALPSRNGLCGPLPAMEPFALL